MRRVFFLLAAAVAAGCDSKPDATAGKGSVPLSPAAKPQEPPTDPKAGLLAARKGVRTAILTQKGYEKDGPVDPPPPGTFEVVKYKSPAGDLAAYLTADPKDGKKRPAVVWAHGGFGGISGGSFWAKPDPANDQSAAAFREAGLVLMVPSWRGENENPGQYEMFYGEVDDLLAASDHVAGLPYVDPDRVYLAGHSTGGTLVLLAATAGDKFRAAFSFGGAPDLARVVQGGGYGNTPFDPRDKQEMRLRSAGEFAAGIKRPTFYFEGYSDGRANGYVPDAEKMGAKAKELGTPLTVHALPWGDHFSILHAVTRQVAKKIAADTGPECNIAFTPADLGPPVPAGRPAKKKR